jgi:hypothetical protein
VKPKVMLKVMESILVLKPKNALESKATSESEAIVEGCIRACQEQQGSRAIAKGRCEDQERCRDAKEGGSLITRYGR